MEKSEKIVRKLKLIKTEYNFYVEDCEHIIAENEHGITVYMERMIMKAKSDEVVIHIDGDPYNNRTSNLKLLKLFEVSKHFDVKKFN